MKVTRYKKRFWAVYAPNEELICVCVYKKGAMNVARLLQTTSLLPLQRKRIQRGGTAC